jgi:AraC-like DNA-binding protein
MKLSLYEDFNRLKTNSITGLSLDGMELGALCRYEKASYDELLLPKTTLTYVAAGQKRMLVNNREYLLQKGDLLFLPKHSVIFSEIPESETAFESINICVPEGFTGTTFRDGAIFFSQHRTIAHIYSELYLYFKDESHDIRAVLATIDDLLAHCRTEVFSERQRIVHPDDASRVVKTLTEHLYEPLNSPEMAEISHMSLASWKRKFEALFNESPKSWIRKRRLEKAYFTLSTQKISVTDVCETVGFGNNAHFSQQFRKYFGISPGSVRKIH